MRPRFNRSAICSSDNYKASRKAHLDFLKEGHQHFSMIGISGISSSNEDTCCFQPRFKTIKVWGKDIRVTVEEYNNYYANCGF
jgi:hypothetical protein